ncbi:MAG: hypothetical protein AVDCRST_MAG86-3089 [uncultured Truepera sp.]|uniref:ABC3 transporter permease C-terminal domain-containing protein n=1 Tax=uncultured Truepera sp. TaxID=543023 RepID=A0A6J4VQQ8_9DEIN|nr:MAG: hypothetical protein AVDCRST_MAG86-3089 [uncultured Truepera sp.]
MIFKIAWRNLLEYRTKTLIIGVLVALGVGVLVIGNSVLESITRGMEASYVENFTGDLIVRNGSDEAVEFMGGFGAVPPAITGFTEVEAYLQKQGGVVASTPLLTSTASLSKDDETLGAAILWGVQPSSYFRMFPGKFILTDGELLRGGEPGILLSQALVDQVFETHGVELRVGETVLLSGQNNTTGTKIREVKVRGVGYYENSAGLLDLISLVDANTLRALTGLTAVGTESTPDAASDTAASAANENAPLEDGDELFDDALVTEAESAPGTAEIDFDDILGDTSVRDGYLALDNHAWHFLLVDLGEAAPDAVTAGLGTLNGTDLVVEDWRWGAGIVADLAFTLRTILNAVILVIAIVAVTIIMNTLVISVTERMGEIGTIRAMGGQKGFVRRLITTEVLTLTLLFGLVGVAFGGLTIGVLNVLGLPAGNLFLQVLFGGPVLRPVLSISALYVSVIAVAVIGVVASLYPTSVALGVSPVRAMQK